MTAKRSPLKRPTSSRRRSPWSPIATASLDVLRNPEVGREQVRRAGRDDREARRRAGEHVDAALHHPVAAPGEDELGALVERAPDLGGRLAALRAPRTRTASVTPSASRTRRSSGSPPPSVLPEWATTATFIGSRRCRRRARAGRAAREDDHDQRGDSDERSRRRRRADGACRDTCATARRRRRSRRRSPRRARGRRRS